MAKHNDIHSVQKAKKWAAWKNLDFSGGNISNFSFIHHPTVDISTSIQNLGVSLGSDPSSVSNSVSLLKNIELERTRLDPTCSEVLSKSDFLGDEDEDGNEFENALTTYVVICWRNLLMTTVITKVVILELSSKN